MTNKTYADGVAVLEWVKTIPTTQDLTAMVMALTFTAHNKANHRTTPADLEMAEKWGAELSENLAILRMLYFGHAIVKGEGDALSVELTPDGEAALAAIENTDQTDVENN